jgi:hypothetical protein
VPNSRATIADEFDQYLRTGKPDPHRGAWSGDLLTRERHARADLRGALVGEVRRRAARRSHRALPDVDTIDLTRRKVEPMVRGLFSRAEQDTVLAMLGQSVVFLTADNVESVLLGQMFDHAAAALVEAVATAARACELGVEVVAAPALVSEDLQVVAAPDLAVVDPAAGRPAELVVDVAFDGSAAWRFEAYRLLGVPEVWHFGADAVEILVLDGGTYVAAIASALFSRLRRLTLRHIAETAVRSDLVAARRYTARVLDER